MESFAVKFIIGLAVIVVTALLGLILAIINIFTGNWIIPLYIWLPSMIIVFIAISLYLIREIWCLKSEDLREVEEASRVAYGHIGKNLELKEAISEKIRAKSKIMGTLFESIFKKT